MNPLDIALAHHQAGDLDAAVASYRAVLAEDPHHADALHMMGVIAQQRGNSKLALNLMEAALAANARLPWAWFNRALVLRALLRTDEALESAQEALTLDPNLADAWDMAGSLLRQKKRYEEARHYHDHALQLQPHNATFRRTYAALLLTLGEITKAFELVHPDKCPNLKAQDIPLVTGHILQSAGYPEMAIAYYHETFGQHPDLLDLRIDEALAHLKVGHFEEGWALWQNRPDTAEGSFQAIPRWQGERIDHLILYEDQGLGDALQAIRYIPMVRDRVSKITLHLKTDALADLFASSFPMIKILVSEHPPLEGEARCLLMSLPYIFKTDLATIPGSVPYLKTAPSDFAQEQEKLATRLRPRIGLVWAGNMNYGKNYSRSLHFKQFEPILKVAAGHIVSLQKGPQKEQADFKTTDILDADPWLSTFADTAALIQTLDLVITVDTSVAHLAGALGKPVWVLLPFDPDWRWMLEREDSPWYPTMRLFRQTAPHDWTSVMDRAAKDLQSFMRGNGDVLKPSLWTAPPVTQNKNALRLWD